MVIPAPLRALGGLDGELQLELSEPISQNVVIDAIESLAPPLRGTIRNPATGRRRAFVRFFAEGRDLSHTAPDELLPESVRQGREPYLIVGAMAGG